MKFDNDVVLQPPSILIVARPGLLQMPDGLQRERLSSHSVWLVCRLHNTNISQISTLSKGHNVHHYDVSLVVPVRLYDCFSSCKSRHERTGVHDKVL